MYFSISRQETSINQPAAGLRSRQWSITNDILSSVNPAAFIFCTIHDGLVVSLNYQYLLYPQFPAHNNRCYLFPTFQILRMDLTWVSKRGCLTYFFKAGTKLLSYFRGKKVPNYFNMLTKSSKRSHITFDLLRSLFREKVIFLPVFRRRKKWSYTWVIYRFLGQPWIYLSTLWNRAQESSLLWALSPADFDGRKVEVLRRGSWEVMLTSALWIKRCKERSAAVA